MDYNTDLTILPKTDPKSPFHSRIPDNSQQTETLSKRFELWRSIIKSLITYYKTIVISNKQFSIINTNISNSFDFPFFTNVNTTNVGSFGDSMSLDLMDPKPENLKKQSFFSNFGEGSIQDIQILLKKYHLNLAIHQKEITNNLNNEIIPKLEELQKDLILKIKEIKNLNNDFKNNSLKEEIALTGQLLNDYIKSMTNLINKGDCEKDPYLLRIQLEIQLKQQLHIENSLEEVFMNLQMTSLMLEKIIFKEIQSSLNKYSELISQEIFIHYNDLINELHQGIINKKSYFEWDNFIDRDNGKTFLKLKHGDNLPNSKKISNLIYPFNKSILSKTIRSGYLYKKSKFLKTYSKSFFILTLNYLHEFKSSNLNDFNNLPINSIKLNDCLLYDSNEIKFQLKVKTKDGKNISYVFKNHEQSINEFQKWIIDLKSLTSFNSFNERCEYISIKLKSGTISPSNGLNTSSSSTTLYPVGSNISIRSKAQTPKLEIMNPMDLASFTSKLENLKLERKDNNNSNNSNKNNNNDYIPTIQPPIDLTRPKLALETSSSSLLTAPTVQIFSPTPTRPNANQNFPIMTQSQSKSNNIINESSTSHKKNNSDDSSISVSRSVTPMIGLNEINNNSIQSPDENKQIQLNNSLYEEQSNTVDLSDLLRQR